ncbi:MAG: Ig-like domain-containing protein [Pseudomonadota bacterium]
MATIIGTDLDEKLIGTAFEDLIEGQGGDDRLKGKQGNDVLIGGEGSDRLKGGDGLDTLVDGAGMDRLIGGADADLFVIGLDGDKDVIRDFEVGIDTIRLDGLTAEELANVTVTTLKPGRVEVLHGGDRLIVRDRDGVLTAEDLFFAAIAADDTAATLENTPTTIDVLANDFGTGLTITSLDQTGTLGSVTLTEDGQVAYDPTGGFGLVEGAVAQDSFSYEATDANGNTTTGTVMVDVTGTNTAPTTSDVPLTIAEGSTGTFNLDLFADDSDPEDTLVFEVEGAANVSQNSRSIFTFDARGSQFERLAADETATQTLNYTATDPSGATSSSQILVTIEGRNDRPEANDRTAFAEGFFESFFFTGTLSASDIDGDELTFSGAGIEEDGSFILGVFAEAGTTETRVVDFTVTDEFGLSDTGTVTLTYTNLSDDPIIEF